LNRPPQPARRWIKAATPLILLAGLAAHSMFSLESTSGRPLPAFALPDIRDASTSFTLETLSAPLSLINVWASWCVSCQMEHEEIRKFTQSTGIPVFGINYRDSRSDAQRWLDHYGDIYRLTGYDPEGEVAHSLGVSAVPTTILVSDDGMVLNLHTGPVSEGLLRRWSTTHPSSQSR
jgi:cytochrome c biogenesis protein CcmG/thiol:disulfide interchange protein DsbE